eukprot:scaffold7976_cov179-Ochromonas_danica.AAC.6
MTLGRISILPPHPHPHPHAFYCQTVHLELGGGETPSHSPGFSCHDVQLEEGGDGMEMTQ